MLVCSIRVMGCRALSGTFHGRASRDRETAPRRRGLAADQRRVVVCRYELSRAARVSQPARFRRAARVSQVKISIKVTVSDI